MRRLIYGPPNWLVVMFSAEDRRAFGFWTIIFAAVGAVFFGRAVLYVTILSVVALIPNYTSETPVEQEGAATATAPAPQAAPPEKAPREPWDWGRVVLAVLAWCATVLLAYLIIGWLT